MLETSQFAKLFLRQTFPLYGIYAFLKQGVILTRSITEECKSIDKQCIVKFQAAESSGTR